jgi:hypothetical protein
VDEDWFYDARKYVARDITEAAELILGVPVKVDERVLLSLWVVDKDGDTANMGTVWRNLAASVPAVSSLYQTLSNSREVSLSDLPNATPISAEAHGYWKLDWFETLTDTLTIRASDAPSREDTLTGAARRSVESGTLTLPNLASSMIEAGKLTRRKKDGKRKRDWPQVRETGIVYRHLARIAGISGSVTWSPESANLQRIWTSELTRCLAADPSAGSQQFLMYAEKQGVRIVPFGVMGAYRISDSPLTEGTSWLARGNLIQQSSAFSIEALAHLEDLMNVQAREAEFQRFFEQHPEFLLTLGPYRQHYPQVILQADEGPSLIPDFFLERMDIRSLDILEIKRSSVPIVRRQRSRIRFRDCVDEALAQLNHYRDWFDDRSHREAFQEAHDLTVYRPRVAVVIGRAADFGSELERLSLESQLPGHARLVTYDDVTRQAREWRRVLSASG